MKLKLLYKTKEVVSIIKSLYELSQKEKMGFSITLQDVEEMPNVLIKGRMKK